MAEFQPAIDVVMSHEGGVADLAGDPGGKTAFGWSTPMCERLGIELPKSREEAIVLYEQVFWNPLYGRIESQNVATKLLDNSINQGQGAGIRHLQQALCRAGAIVTVDGRFGPATLKAVNLTPAQLILPHFRLIQWQSYVPWIERDPARARLRLGLARRAAWPDAGDTIALGLMNGTYNPGAQNGTFSPVEPAGI